MPKPAKEKKGVASWLHSQKSMTAEAQKYRFQRVFQAVDKILNPGVKSLEYSAGIPSPGGTDGTTIMLNPAMLPPLGGNHALTVWAGINVHELGHTLYTPRQGSKLVKNLLHWMRHTPSLGLVFNIIEDPRQERLMIAQYPGYKAYLIAACAAYMPELDENRLTRLTDWGHGKGCGCPTCQRMVKEYLADATKGLAACWPAMAGRTWVDPKLRLITRQAFEVFASKAEADTVIDLVGEYQRMSDPAEYQAERAFDIVKELHDLMASLGLMPSGGCDSPDQVNQPGSTSGTNPFPSYGQDQPAVADEDAVPSAGSEDDYDNLSAAEQAAEDERRQAEAEEAQGKGANGEGEDGDEGEGDTGSGDAEGEGDTRVSGDGKGKGEGADGETPGGGAGKTGVGDKTKAKAPNLADLIKGLEEQVAWEIAIDPEVRREVADYREAVEKLSSHTKAVPLTDRLTMVEAPEPYLRLAADLIAGFRRFTDASLPYYERRVEHGRLNAGRYLRARAVDQDFIDLDVMFDRFQQGHQDEMSLDVSVLIDGSGSMGRGVNDLIGQACAAAWAIRRAVEEAEGDVHVYGYDTGSYLMSDPKQKASKSKFELLQAGGGTDPSVALKQTWTRLQNSPARHKLVVMLTDGDWYAGGSTVGAMRGTGVTTIGVVIGSGPHAENALKKMGTEFGAVSTNPNVMVELLDKAATQMLAEAEIQAKQEQAWR